MPDSWTREKFLVKLIQLVAVETGSEVAKADDIERVRCNEFKIGGAHDQLGEVLGLGDVLGKEARQLVQTKSLECHPDFKGAEIAGEAASRNR